MHFKPFTILPGLVIAPTWEEYQALPGEKVLVMDPGMAFGTGHHTTTRLCLEYVAEVVQAEGGVEMLDVGTGTGILSMAALLLGAGTVLGIDNDPDAVAAAVENVKYNKMQDKIQVSIESLSELKGRFPLVVANIVHDVLVSMAQDISRITAFGGTLVLAGLLTGSQADNIKKVFRLQGFELLGQIESDEWAALKFEKI